MTDDLETDYTDAASTFGDRVVAAREQLGLTQPQLAQKLGVKQQTVRNWEEDRSEPRANKLQMLAGMLNVSIIWLMNGNGEGLEKESDGDVKDVSHLSEILLEIRTIRAEQTQLGSRLGRLEKRLAALIR